ncbi:ribose-phosphate diphosphokinase [Candidatus Woesearchaeota archaeon]|nr:ribose-phosphate diphosphokinase [Candidatus Woesearchaeota archaeon]
MLIVSCSHGKHLDSLIAKKSGINHSILHVDKFPDDELRVRFEPELKNKSIALIQSFYKNISDCIIEVILAAKTAKELGAKKVILVAPYFPYMRQDKRFHKGEAVSQLIVTGLIGKYFDAVYLMDPHLHRKNKLGHIFKIKSKKLTANGLIAAYIRKHIKNPAIIGPDEESYKWAKNVAEMIDAESMILNKKRYSSHHVEIKLNKKINLRNKNAVIVDDIISTGNTILETAKILRRLGAKKIYCICVHGIFVNDALSKLKKAKINVISTNTIPNKAARIDVSGLIAESFKDLD